MLTSRCSLVPPKRTPDQNQSVSIAQPESFSCNVILENPGYVQRRAANCCVSLIFHIAVAGVLVLLSFLSPVAVRVRPWTRVMLVMPLVSKEPVSIHQHAVASRPNRFSSLQFVAPIILPRNIVPDSPPLPSNFSAPASQGSSEETTNLLVAFISKSDPLIAPPPEADHLRPLQQGGAVKSPRPLGRIVLVYPELAKAAQVFGKVVIHAIIDETGRVIDARAVSGPPLLYASAVDAISKERFVPLLLNGMPTKCDLKVQVRFTLNDTRF